MTRGKRPRTADAVSHSKKPWEAVARQEVTRGEVLRPQRRAHMPKRKESDRRRDSGAD